MRGHAAQSSASEEGRRRESVERAVANVGALQIYGAQFKGPPGMHPWPRYSLVTPVWAPCKLFNIRFVTKIDGHFRPKIAISSQDYYVIKPVLF